MPSKERAIYSSKFGFNSNMTLVSYVPKKNKAVILVSTQHHSSLVRADDVASKPQIIDFYNVTKGAVDSFDQMIEK